MFSRFFGPKTQVVACLFVVCCSFANSTEGYFSVGWGTKQKGLVGAGVAMPLDSLIVSTNPAGLAFLNRRWDAGLELFSPMRGYSATAPTGPGGFMPGRVSSNLENFPIPEFGVNWTQPDGSAFGLAVYGNGGMNTSYPASANGGYGVFGAGVAGVNLSQLFVSGTYARKVAPGASVGVSAIYARQYFEASGLANFAAYVPHSAPYNLSNNGEDTSEGFGVRVGLQAEVTPQLTLGAAYQPKIKMSRFHRYSDLFADHGNFDIPESYTAGLAYKLSENDTVVADVRQINYSGVPSVGNPFSNMPNGLGSKNGPGFGWRDMTIYKLGYQKVLNDQWTARCGVSYGRQPIPSSEILFNVLAPGVQEWHFTLGASKKVGENGEFNAVIVYSPDKKVRGINPNDPGQVITLHMHQFNAEIGFSKKF